MKIRQSIPKQVAALAAGILIAAAAGPARAAFSIVNGDFESGIPDQVNQNDVAGWFDQNTAGTFNTAWQTSIDSIVGTAPGNGEGAVIFSNNGATTDPFVGAFLYQGIGANPGAVSLALNFDWGNPADAPAREVGLTVSIYESNGSFVSADDVDVRGASGVTLLDSVSLGQVFAAASFGNTTRVFDISGQTGGELFLRFNNFKPNLGSGAQTQSWTLLDNVSIGSAPVISGLTNQTVVEGDNAILAPAVSGTPAPVFQWKENGVDIAGATNASLTLENVQYAQDGKVYSLIAGNFAGIATNSITLTVIVPPLISGLVNQSVAPGTSVSLATTVSGVPTPTLQWLHDGAILSDGATGNGSSVSGSTSDTLSITSAQIADGGTYSLVASNAAGVTTNSMDLTVSGGIVAPEITGLMDQTVVEGNPAVFSATVTGLPVPAVQWYRNGSPVGGATNASLTVANVSYSQNGEVYSLVADNGAGIASNNATLYVLVPPSISQQPTNIAVVAGTAATFSVAATGVPALSYQWYRNGSPISGANGSSYTLSNPQGADNGATFHVVVGNSVDTATSSTAVLTVLTAMTGSFLPANNAMEIAPDQQLRIVFSGGTPELAYAGKKLHVHDASDDSLVATIDTGDFQTYTLDGATISNAFVRTVQGANYYYMPIAVFGNEAWITLGPNERFEYGKSYYVAFDTGLFVDSAGASFPGVSGPSTWRFSTKASGPATPTASTGPTRITVGLDGAGDFATLQGASDWIPQNNTLRRTIVIQPGTYHDFAVFQQNRNQVTVTGATTNRNDVQLIYPNVGSASGWHAALLFVQSSDMDFRNFTIDNEVYLANPLNNSGPFAGRLNTLFTSGDRLIFDNVAIKGGQDTYYAYSGSAYFRHCEVWGSVDFIYGGAVAVFDQCNIVQIRDSGGVVAAPYTDYNQPYGLVFLGCTFPRALTANGYPYNVATASSNFMRPWNKDAMAAVINGSVGSQISAKGWGEWGGREATCRAREYGTTLIGGGSVTPASRQAAGAYWLNTVDPDYTNNPALDAADPLLALPNGPANRVAVGIDPSDYTPAAIFGHSYFTQLHGWSLETIPVIMAAPTNTEVHAGASTSFSVTAYGFPSVSYQWLKDGTNLVGATHATLAIANAQPSDAGTYSVVVSNSAGSASGSATLALIGPSISQYPEDQTLTIGLTATFAASGTGTPSPELQWLKDGAPIPGATNWTFVLVNAQVANSGVYSLSVSNTAGTVVSSNAVLAVEGPDGACMVNGTTTGGSGGPIVTVDNGTDFNTQINTPGPRIILVKGVISIAPGDGDGRCFTTSNKTILGVGTNAMLYGNLNFAHNSTTNVIVRNLRISSRARDGISIWDAKHVWVDHCTFYDCADGMCDMNNDSKYVTVSWCKFHYVDQQEHRFTMIADGYSNATTHAISYADYTLHHNWWSTGCDQRMAASTWARVHYYNNFFNSPGNQYCSIARIDTEILSENNHYLEVRDPLFNGIYNGKIQSSGNIYSGCTGTIHPGTDTVFAPAYGYALDTAAEVPAIVMAGAGAPGPDTLPIPPKTWDGGGTDNNMNTANNWSSNVTPKWSDALVFAGSSRLSPNNNLYYGVQFSSLVFSNNAGAFTLGGRPFKIGDSIQNDSPATQTINADMDFGYGEFHYTTNRYFNVASPSGSLVLNGDIAGDSTAYYNSYGLHKLGPGLLTLNGINTFRASLHLDGGLLQFNTLSTNQPGSLGVGNAIIINGGGLRWAPGNTADISTRAVAIQSGGATLDSGANNIVFSSPVGQGGSGGLTKTGSGRITLNGNNTYSGPTLIDQGTLALGTSGAFPNSPQIVLANHAVLDVSGRSDGKITLAGNSLVGHGTILGSVTVGQWATVSPGFSLGTLMVDGALEFQSGSSVAMELDTSEPGINDFIGVMDAVTYGGSLVVANLGPALAAGDTFKLFDAASYDGSFDSIALPPLTGDLVWTNNLAVDGTLSVVSPSGGSVNTTPTNIVFSMVGSNMTFSWPADHIGWTLEAQTNNLGTNWFSIPGSAETNLIELPFFPDADSAFFRLRYP